MKKLLTIGVFFGLLGTSSLLATQQDIWLTGSTAFRNNAYEACVKLFDTNGTLQINTNNTTAIGNTSNLGTDKVSAWCMAGTMTNILGVANNQTIAIHGTFNGSVAGLFALGQKFGVQFVLNASPNGDSALTTNTPTAAFSDVDSKSTLYPLPGGSYYEDHTCVQPFAFFKSVGSKASVITNVAFGQLGELLSGSTAPLSMFTGNAADNSTTIYLVQRTLDSGTRVTTYAEGQFYGAATAIYYYDNNTDTNYFVASTNRYTDPLFTAGNFGYGYVGGGDIATVLGISAGGAATNNNAIAYLSFSDGKGVGGGSWLNMLSYNGQYPILNYTPGSAPATNDFAPVINGKYSFWAYECLDWAKSAQYGTYSDQSTPYAVASAVLNHLAGFNGTISAQGHLVGGIGSIDNEILLSNPKTAVRIFDMNCSRQNVGSTITPF